MFFVVLLLFPKKNQQHVRICLFYQDELITCLAFCVVPQDLIAWYCVLTCCCLFVYQDELVNVRTFVVVVWSNSLPRWVGKLFVCLFSHQKNKKISGKMSVLSCLAFFHQTKLVRCSYVFTFVFITKISSQFVRICSLPWASFAIETLISWFPLEMFKNDVSWLCKNSWWNIQTHICAVFRNSMTCAIKLL